MKNPLQYNRALGLSTSSKEDYCISCLASLPQIRMRLKSCAVFCSHLSEWRRGLTQVSMDSRLELDVLIFPDEVRVATPEDLREWELETASQVSIPTVRLFVALYPYNPAAMSPNHEAAAEELPFVPGQIIKVKIRHSFRQRGTELTKRLLFFELLMFNSN